MTTSEERRLLAATRDLLAIARAEGPRYASGYVPISTGDFTRMLTKLGCRRIFVDAPEESDGSVRAATLPPAGGYHWIGIRRDLDELERTFAERHELAHILNGDADDFIQLADRDYDTWEERKADLFAMADIFPRQLFDSYVRAGFTWKAMMVEIRKAITADFGPRWPVARIRDRARLRVLLYREHGI